MASEWSISVPLSALVALEGLPGQMEKLTEENKQLRREIDALRRIQTDTLTLVADLRRELRHR